MKSLAGALFGTVEGVRSPSEPRLDKLTEKKKDKNQDPLGIRACGPAALDQHYLTVIHLFADQSLPLVTLKGYYSWQMSSLTSLTRRICSAIMESSFAL